MNMLGRAFQGIRAWFGLDDASESRLTPSLGWLLPAPADARRQSEGLDGRRAARLLDQKGVE